MRLSNVEVVLGTKDNEIRSEEIPTNSMEYDSPLGLCAPVTVSWNLDLSKGISLNSVALARLHHTVEHMSLSYHFLRSFILTMTRVEMPNSRDREAIL